MSKTRLNGAAMKVKFLILIMFFSSLVFGESLKHEFKDGMIRAQVFKNGKYSVLDKNKGKYGYTIFDENNNSIFELELPWQPTHASSFNKGSKTLIGSLKRNGHKGVNELYVFDESGLIQTISDVIRFDAISDDGSFYAVKDKKNKQELLIFNSNGSQIKNKIFNKGFDHHSLLSISPDGSRLSLSGAGPDMSSRKSVRVYHGESFEEFNEWDFGGLPIYQVHQLKDNVTILNVKNKIIAFKDNQQIWEFPRGNSVYRVDTVLPSQDGKYVLISKMDSPVDFLVIRQDGKIMFESSKSSELLEYLGNGDGFSYHLSGNSLVIRHRDHGVVDIIALSSGKRKNKLDLGLDKILDINEEFALILSSGKIKRVKL
jgi:hypothetical protein